MQDVCFRFGVGKHSEERQASNYNPSQDSLKAVNPVAHWKAHVRLAAVLPTLFFGLNAAVLR